MRNGGVRLQIYRTNHLKIQILLKREKISVEINILWLEVRLENVRYIEIIHARAKVVICSKLVPKTGSCQTCDFLPFYVIR